MSPFVVGQRFLSEAEPELGLGSVEEVAGRRLLMRFPAADTVRRYAVPSAPIKRVAFRVGDEIENESGLRFEVEHVEEDEGLIVYLGDGHRVVETDLSGALRFSKPEERLLAGHWDESRVFDLRRRTWMRQYESRKSPARGFVGARMELIPHQLYISHEVASRPSPRALLADEVGLGKTIEAGLVLHRMLRSGQATRVLVLVPETLVHQWFVELLRRFHLSFTIVNESFCEAVLASDGDANPFTETQTVIADVDWVAATPERSSDIREASWDLVVVDEAHHLERGGAPYRLLESLAREVPGLLLLTATPEQLGEENHYSRLRLLDPDRYPSFERYRSEAQHFRQIARLASKLLDGESLGAAEARELQGLLPSRTSLRGRLEAALGGAESERAALVRELIDHHGPGRVMFRNTRGVLDQVPERRAHGVALAWPAEGTSRDSQRARLASGSSQRARLIREFIADTADARPVDLAFDYRDDARARWLVDFLVARAPEKVLVLCRFKEKAIALQDALREHRRIRSAVFHEDLSLLQRDRNAAWFAEEEGAQVLVCSEIGSEGRNFQFAHHLVLFDLPLSVELLEQRIGRLYRIGQEHTVEIHVPFLPGSAQEIVYRWYHEGLDAFETSLPSGASFDELAGLVRELALEHLETSNASGGSDLPEDMTRLIDRTRDFCSEVESRLEEGRDRLLELGSFRPEVSANLIEEIRRLDGDTRLDRYVHDALAHLGVELDEVSARTFVCRKGNQLLVDDLPGLGGDEVAMTADRERATRQGELDFLTWDHPMVTGVMELITSSEGGNSSVAVLVLPGPTEILLEALFVLDVVAPPGLYVDRFLPPTPLRVVVNERLEDVTKSYPAGALAARLLDGRKLLRYEEWGFDPDRVERLIGSARAFAEGRGKLQVDVSREAMTEAKSAELRRIEALAEVNDHVREAEIVRARDELSELDRVLSTAAIRLDALRLILRTPKAPEH